MPHEARARAYVGGRLATGLRDVTSDLGALDSSGFWVVVVTFEGEVTCARFADVRPASLPTGQLARAGGVGVVDVDVAGRLPPRGRDGPR